MIEWRQDLKVLRHDPVGVSGVHLIIDLYVQPLVEGLHEHLSRLHRHSLLCGERLVKQGLKHLVKHCDVLGLLHFLKRLLGKGKLAVFTPSYHAWQKAFGATYVATPGWRILNNDPTAI